MTIEQLFDDIIIDYCEQGIAINSVESLVSAIEGCEDYKTHVIEKKVYGADDVYTIYIKIIDHCMWTHTINYRLNENDAINIMFVCDFERKLMHKNK